MDNNDIEDDEWWYYDGSMDESVMVSLLDASNSETSSKMGNIIANILFNKCMIYLIQRFLMYLLVLTIAIAYFQPLCLLYVQYPRRTSL